ncbi:hypothetical protein R3P38DRAFT_3041985 [Favolaschia claudopus]|uniref:Uncharacterized protein n=1 Tax=Favolaschia claudopus TaxID=2862362 RepID=A0AAW0A8H7_9AGAR
MFSVGTRCFYWNAKGQVVYGTVQNAIRSMAGEPIVTLRTDGGATVHFPQCNVTKVGGDYPRETADSSERLQKRS